MTAPTFARFQQLLVGWLFARRRTITGMLRASGLANQQHHSAFHRLFSAARWSLDEFGLALFVLLGRFVEGQVLLALDDTLCRKRGKRMFGVGMHHDPLLSSRSHTVTNWGHSWVVLCVVVRLPFAPERSFSLPLLFRLYLNKKAAERARAAYRTRPHLAVEVLKLLCARHPERRFHLVADSSYAGHSVLDELPSNCDLTSRLVLNARLHAACPPREKGQIGRPRLRGKRLPTPAQMLKERAQRFDLKLYGRKDRVRAVTCVAYLHKVPKRPLRIVVIEPLSGGRPLQAFFSTQVDDTAEDVLVRYSCRWSIEEAIQASKSYLGFEEPQGWTKKAVLRTAPMAMLLYSLVVAWFALEGHERCPLTKWTWYVKSRPSFADMLATLKRESLRESLSSLQVSARDQQKVLGALCLASHAVT